MNENKNFYRELGFYKNGLKEVMRKM